MTGTILITLELKGSLRVWNDWREYDFISVLSSDGTFVVTLALLWRFMF